MEHCERDRHKTFNIKAVRALRINTDDVVAVFAQTPVIRAKVQPDSDQPPCHFPGRTGRADSSGRVTPYHGVLTYHIMIGKKLRGKLIKVYTADCDITIIT
jgi:hypothetical protein